MLNGLSVASTSTSFEATENGCAATSPDGHSQREMLQPASPHVESGILKTEGDNLKA